MTPEEIKALMEKIKMATKEQLGELTAEQKQAIADAKKEIEEKMGASLKDNLEMKTLVKNLEIQLSEMKTAMSRSNLGGQDDGNADQAVKSSPEFKKAFNRYMRKGIEIARDMIESEFKSMNVQIDEDGGFLVTPEVSAEIVKRVFEMSPMRELSSITTISTDSLNIYEDLDEADAGWVGEEEDRPETGTPKINMINIPVHEMYAKPKVTQKLLDDALWNVESWLQEKVSSKFSRIESAAFVKGNGVLKPKGFLAYEQHTDADTFHFGKIYTPVSSTIGSFTADDILDLIGDFKEAYEAGLVIQIHRTALKTLRKLKDLQGQYLWGMGVNGLRDSAFAGIPVRLSSDLEPLANGSRSIAIGDFRQGYQIVDRFGVRVLRDPFTAKPNVLFYSTKRVGGGVKNFEAIKVIKTKAS